MAEAQMDNGDLTFKIDIDISQGTALKYPLIRNGSFNKKNRILLLCGPKSKLLIRVNLYTSEFASAASTKYTETVAFESLSKMEWCTGHLVRSLK